MAVRVLTWNLFHGRAKPPDDRDLFADFAAALESWRWDVALLQECPPWWPRRLGARHHVALTSRNLGLPARRWLAQRRPELMKSGGGSANAIVVRDGSAVGPIRAHAHRRLRVWPERRVVHGVDLGGLWVANLHAQVHSAARAAADIELAARTALRWAAGAPVLLGGDLNVRDPRLPGFEVVASHNVDHLATVGLRVSGEVLVPRRGRLSDHAPLSVEVVPLAGRPVRF